MADPLVGVKKEEKVDEARVSLNNQLLNMSRRLQILEGKHDNLRAKSTLFENNNIDLTNSLRNDLNKLSQDIGNLKTEIKKTNDTLKLVIEELKLRAKDSDLKVLEKYVDFFNPLKYVTEKEVRLIISEMMKNTPPLKKEEKKQNEEQKDNDEKEIVNDGNINLEDEFAINKIEQQIKKSRNKLKEVEDYKKEKEHDDKDIDEENNHNDKKKYKITDLL